MNIDLEEPTPKRKVLSLKTEQEHPQSPAFIAREHCHYMVWRVGGDEPKRIYGPDESQRAINHAKELSEKTGEEFHVFRTWRGFAPDPIG